MVHLARWTMFLGLLASAVWMGKSLDWGSISAFLVTLSGFLGTEVLEHRRAASQSRLEADRKLFQSLQSLLPSNGAVRYFKDTDMALPIDDEELKPLHRFVYEWNNPEHEFLDKAIQEKFTALMSKTNEFLASVALNTYADIPGKQVVPKDWLDKGLEEKYKHAVADLNQKADSMVQAHEDSFRTARRVLNI